MGSVTSLFVRKVVAATGDALDCEALLRSVGLNPYDEADVARMISDTAYYDLLERIARMMPDVIGFPLAVGASMRCDEYGVFGLAWKAAPTLRASFARAERYARCLTSVTAYEVVEDARGGWYIAHREGARRLGLRLSTEATIASVAAISREVATAPFAPLEVHFQHPAPASLEQHEAYFGCPVIFGSDRDALLVSAEALARPNRLGDEGMTRFLVQHLDQTLAEYDDAPGLRESVRDAIARALSEGPPKVAAIARTLGMSERTLHRRLKAEEISFQGVVDAVRRGMAESLLVQSDYPLAEIAFMTGFSEQSAFTRAFRRWEATTPAAYREARRAG